MKSLFSLCLLLNLTVFPTISAASESFSINKYQSLLCDMVVSAYKKTIKTGRPGGNITLSKCPGYAGKVGNQNDWEASKSLLRAYKKKPVRVKNGGKGAENTWQLLHLIGTPADVMNSLLNEKEFWAVSEELNKTSENIRKNKGKKIIIERY